MPIREGGHALMLKVTIPPKVREEAKKWLAAEPGREDLTGKAHLTVIFIGRDLDERHHQKIIDAGKWLAEKAQLPRQLLSKGFFSMFGGKKTLAAPLMDDERLTNARNMVERGLHHHGIPVKRDYANYNPHVSLGKSPVTTIEPQVRIHGGTFDVMGVEVKLGSEYMNLPMAWSK